MCLSLVEIWVRFFRCLSMREACSCSRKSENWKFWWAKNFVNLGGSSRGGVSCRITSNTFILAGMRVDEEARLGVCSRKFMLLSFFDNVKLIKWFGVAHFGLFALEFSISCMILLSEF